MQLERLDEVDQGNFKGVVCLVRLVFVLDVIQVADEPQELGNDGQIVVPRRNPQLRRRQHGRLLDLQLRLRRGQPVSEDGAHNLQQIAELPFNYPQLNLSLYDLLLARLLICRIEYILVL